MKTIPLPFSVAMRSNDRKSIVRFRISGSKNERETTMLELLKSYNQ